MTNKLQPVRGTKDLYGDDARLFTHIANTAARVAGYYGFAPIATPIFEFTEVFKRTLGEASDIVSKEMYTLEDRGGSSLTLRPEFTAGIARCFISNGMTQQLPLKLFSYGALFRYERPQKGRQRQFHQINFECLGLDKPQSDVEVIALADHIIKELGIADKITLELNSLGDGASRTAYRDALVKYFSKYKNDLSEDSQRRLESNPLRILDSKDAGDKKLVVDAPKLQNHYSAESQAFLDAVLAGLDNLGINYTRNERLVRGLDYYCDTVFEFTTTELGAQNAVFAGGRYNALIEMMGGPETPAIGFAGGIERLMGLVEYNESSAVDIALVSIGEAQEALAYKLAQELRQAQISCECYTSGSIGKRLKKIDKAGVRFAAVFGEDEVKTEQYLLKDLQAGNEQQVNADLMVATLKELLA